MPADKKEKSIYFHPKFWICLSLILITLLIYRQVGSFEFINYDTDRYVYENKYVTAGLTKKSIGWAFTTVYASNWHPVTWLSHMLDVQIFGLKPGWHHLSNVMLHLANTIVLFLILARMTGDMWKCGLVAALFAIHPLHVQSVAWVAERKDLLSTFFGLLAVGSYLRYVRSPRIGSYLTILLFFVLCLMSKPMWVTLPFLLLLFDYWPLKRFYFRRLKKNDDSDSREPAIVTLIAEKTPLFLVAAGSCIMTVYAQQNGGAIGSMDLYPLHLRIVNALVSYGSYIVKTIWPMNLAVIYPHPEGFAAWQVVMSILMLSGISLWAIVDYRSRPWFIVGWLCFLGTLIPVIGLVQVGTQAMADRYTYVPLIGLFIIIAWGIPDLLGRRSNKRLELAIITFGVLSSLIAVSWNQVGYWKNSITLFEHTLEVTENNFIAHNNLGHRLLELGKTDEAQRQFEKAVEINPKFEIAYLNLGLVFANQKKLNQAVKYYSKALQLKPNYTVAHNNLGNTWYRLGKAERAYKHYLAAVKINPTYAEAYNNLGAAAVRMGDLKRAVIFFQTALNIRPEFTGAHNNLKNTIAALEKLGRNSDGSR